MSGPVPPSYPPPKRSSSGAAQSSSSVMNSRANPLLKPKNGSGSAVPKTPPKASSVVVSRSNFATVVSKPKSEVPVIFVEASVVPSSSSSSSVRSFKPISQERLVGVEAWAFDGGSGILREQRLNTIGVVAQDARVVAVDWHQVRDTWRLNRREASRAGEETADLPKQVLEFYRVVRSYLRPQDKIVILSHIERSERNKRFLLRAVNHCQLPVDLV